MRRWLLPALMIPLLLCSCGKAAPEQRLEALRETLSAAEEVRVVADIDASIGTEVFSCSVDCTANAERAAVTLTAPETVAGIRAVVSADGMQLEYEGLSLSVGPVAGPEAPVSAVPLLIDALRRGSALRSWTEWEGDKTLFVREFYVTDERVLTVWFDAGASAPVHAELRRNGVCVLRCEIREFSFGNNE